MNIFEDVNVLKKIIDKPLSRIAKQTSLTLNEIRVLLFLYENEKFDIASDIVERLMLSKAHVSLSVEQLVSKKYIKKVQDESNKKKIHLKLTSNSKEVLDLLDIEIERIKGILLNNVSMEDRKAFKRALKQIIKNTKELA